MSAAIPHPTGLGRPRVLVAPDKLKGTLTAVEAAHAIGDGVHDVWPSASVTTLPFADGGEGTVDALVAAGAETRVDTVTGPLGEPVDARWALLGDVAMVEMAAASGLPLVTPSPRTALASHTEGTGELIRLAIAAGARRVLVGVGGSASTDGGAGALRALGVRLLDASGAPAVGGGGDLARIASVDASAARALLAGVELVLCSDVANPFVGERGAAHVFGPQKGADPATVALLDDGLRSFARVVDAATGVDLEGADWGGSGGGIAGGLVAVLGASAADGVELLADLLDLDAAIAASDLVVVAEGSLDSQSLMGKTPVGIARHAAALGVPCVAVAGRVLVDASALAEVGIADAVAAVDVAPSPADALAEPARWLRAATVEVLRRR
ncbi:MULTISPECIES: glycerate kinase [unclassified Agrococcus]|uniref:glycerate kinase n=1 Tax=unclassified Agrococcus TaxID=2615065 RepID=UPI00360B5F00